MTTPNATVEAKLYVKSSTIHRVEMPKEAGGMIFLRPPKARGKIWMLDPAKKQYTILSWQQSSKDPIGAWTNIQYDMVGSVAGNETINGRSDKGSSLLLAFI